MGRGHFALALALCTIGLTHSLRLPLATPSTRLPSVSRRADASLGCGPRQMPRTDATPRMQLQPKSNRKAGEDGVGGGVGGVGAAQVSAGKREARVGMKEGVGNLPFGAEIYFFITEPIVEVTVAFLVLLGCGLMAAETVSVQALFYKLEDLISVTFVIEYLLRWYSHDLRPTYLFKWEMIIDLVAFLPFLMQQEGFMGFTFVRLLRILRLQRFLMDVDTFQRLIKGVLPSSWKIDVSEFELQVVRIFSQIFTVLFITSGLIYNAERSLNPNLRDFFSAFYFSLTTLTTVGYGDITPQTPAGRTIMSVMILFGIGFIPYQLSTLAQLFFTGGAGQKGVALPGARGGAGGIICGECGESAHVAQAVFCYRCGTKIRGSGSCSARGRDEEGVMPDLGSVRIFGSDTLSRQDPAAAAASVPEEQVYVGSFPKIFGTETLSRSSSRGRSVSRGGGDQAGPVANGKLDATEGASSPSTPSSSSSQQNQQQPRSRSQDRSSPDQQQPRSRSNSSGGGATMTLARSNMSVLPLKVPASRRKRFMRQIRQAFSDKDELGG